MVITTLAHNIDLAWMYEAYRQTRKSGAVGIDKVTAEQYSVELDENLFATGPFQDWDVPSAGGEEGPDTKGRREANAADRDTDL